MIEIPCLVKSTSKHFPECSENREKCCVSLGMESLLDAYPATSREICLSFPHLPCLSVSLPFPTQGEVPRRFSKKQQLDEDLVPVQYPCLFPSLMLLLPCYKVFHGLARTTSKGHFELLAFRICMFFKLCRTRALMLDVSYVCLSLVA